MPVKITAAQKIAEYETLREQAHKLVDILNRSQLRRLIGNHRNKITNPAKPETALPEENQK